MNYKDIKDWPIVPVEEIERDDIETLYSFGSYDGPYTGLIKWNGKFYWASRFSIDDYRYWVIELDQDHGQRLFEDSRNSDAIAYKRNGKPAFTGTPLEHKKLESFKKTSSFEKPADDAKVVGYFLWWQE